MRIISTNQGLLVIDELAEDVEVHQTFKGLLNKKSVDLRDIKPRSSSVVNPMSTKRSHHFGKFAPVYEVISKKKKAVNLTKINLPSKLLKNYNEEAEPNQEIFLNGIETNVFLSPQDQTQYTYQDEHIQERFPNYGLSVASSQLTVPLTQFKSPFVKLKQILPPEKTNKIIKHVQVLADISIRDQAKKRALSLARTNKDKDPNEVLMKSLNKEIVSEHSELINYISCKNNTDDKFVNNLYNLKPKRLQKLNKVCQKMREQKAFTNVILLHNQPENKVDTIKEGFEKGMYYMEKKVKKLKEINLKTHIQPKNYRAIEDCLSVAQESWEKYHVNRLYHKK